MSQDAREEHTSSQERRTLNKYGHRAGSCRSVSENVLSERLRSGLRKQNQSQADVMYTAAPGVLGIPAALPSARGFNGDLWRRVFLRISGAHVMHEDHT